MRLFHPLHPLTESGRVLVCLATAVFAALLLVAWAPLHADEADTVQVVAPLTCAGAAR